jgi:hypothetical protein
MQTMKIAETVNVADENGMFLFGGKVAGRKNPLKVPVPVKAEFKARACVDLKHAITGELVLTSRNGVQVYAAPLAELVNMDLPELLSIPEGFEPGDVWAVTNKAGGEVAEVEGATMDDARKAARNRAAVRRVSKAEGGFSLRRKLVEKAVKAPEATDDYGKFFRGEAPLHVVVKAEEKPQAPAKKPGKAPANFVELAQSGNTEAARAYWSRRVAEYEG